MSFSFVSEAKKATHGIAIGVTALGAWAFSDQGQKVIGGFISAYPKLSVLGTVLGIVGAVYFNPKTKPAVTQ